MSGEPIPRPCPQARTPRTPDSPEPIPSAGVMLHLLGAVALGWSVAIWVVLVVSGVITASVFGVAVASIALTSAAAWAVWLVRATNARDVDEHDGFGSGWTAGNPTALGDALDPEERFHRN